MNKKRILSVALMTILVVNAFAQTAADSVFNDYFAATGGKTLWDSVTTYTMKQSFVSNAPSDFDMEVKASLPDAAMLKTKTIMKRSFIYAVNPTDAFFRVPLGSRDKAIVYETKDLNDREKMNMKREALDWFSPFYNYQTKGYIATYVGIETLGTQQVQRVELAGPGIKYDLYFDPATRLLVRSVERLSSGEEITRVFTNYVTSPFGIRYASTGTYFSSIDKRNVRLSTQIVFNPAFDDTVFKR